MRWSSGSVAVEASRRGAFSVGAGSLELAEGLMVRKPEPAGAVAPGFVISGLFPSACAPRSSDFAGGGASGGGGTTSVWGDVVAGPECQVGLAERARLESVGDCPFEPSCGAASGLAAPRRYNPAATKASQVEASMSLMRAMHQLSAVSHQLSAISHEREHPNVASEG